MKKTMNIINDIWNSQVEQVDQQTIGPENKTLHALLNSLAEGVIVADKDGKFLFFNDAAKKILGIGTKDISPEEWTWVYGCYLSDTVTPYPGEQLPLSRAIRGEDVINEVIFIKNENLPDGIYINVCASPFKGTDNSVIGGTVIFNDITRSKRAEVALKQSEERLKAQFNGFPIPTYVWQHEADDFTLIDFNHAADIFTGGKIRNNPGISSSKLFANYPEIQDDIWRCFENKTTIEREMSYQLQENHEEKELILRYVFMPQNLVLLHMEDITERKKNEKELKKLSNVVEQTADSVIITNNQGVIEYVNPAFENITGYSREEAVGQRPSMLKSGKHDKTFYDKLWGTIREGNSYQGTIINRKKSGEIYWSEQTITPLKDKNQQITNYVSVLKDITDLKKKQEHEFSLNIAREIQKRLYKPSITLPGFDVAGATFSAQETNGDYFDFFPMKDGYIGLVVGDVSGHGISSALIMTATRAYLRAFVKTESDPGKILNLLNKELVADLDEYHYVTLVFARIDPTNNRLDYVSAGHVPGYLLNSSGEVEYEMKSTDIPLGYIPDYEYHLTEPFELAPESILVFLTDGIVEARNTKETEFGYERAIHCIKSHRQTSASQLVEKLYQEVRLFSEDYPQEDDITSIICKVNDADKRLNKD